MKMHEKYRFFCMLYKKVQIFFCNGLKNFAIGKKPFSPKNLNQITNNLNSNAVKYIEIALSDYVKKLIRYLSTNEKTKIEIPYFRNTPILNFRAAYNIICEYHLKFSEYLEPKIVSKVTIFLYFHVVTVFRLIFELDRFFHRKIKILNRKNKFVKFSFFTLFTTYRFSQQRTSNSFK